jgi:hypothetical protein
MTTATTARAAGFDKALASFTTLEGPFSRKKVLVRKPIDGKTRPIIAFKGLTSGTNDTARGDFEPSYRLRRERTLIPS